MKFVIFSGSARQGNYTKHVASFVQSFATKNYPSHTFEVVSPQSLGIDFSNEGNETELPSLTKLVDESDGFVAITPEYNHGYSASIKYMLDLNLKEYIHKPVAFVGVSKSPFGGIRAIESLVPIVRELGLVATFNDLNVTNVQKEIIDGAFANPEPWERRSKRLFDELFWMASTLKTARESGQKE